MIRLPLKKRKPVPDSVFALTSPFKDPFRHKIFCMVRRSVERVFMLDQVDLVYRTIRDDPRYKGRDFFDSAMEVLNVRIDVAQEDRNRIPESGPLVVVANHPFGGLEGILLMRILLDRRPDVKVMANYLLGRMPEMAAHSILVDPFGNRAAIGKNIAPIKEAIRWLRGGRALLVFPSGEVSHLNVQERRIEDPKWNESIAGIIRHTGASALPVFVEGRNSAVFQMLGMVHPKVRTVLLPRELIRKRGSVMRFRIGNVVPFKRLERIHDAGEMMDYLRLRTYLLMSRIAPRSGKPGGRRLLPRPPVPVARSLYPDMIAQDIQMLPPEACLLQSGELAVYAVTAPQIPRLLHEIGRLREITFRAVGEGTGRAVDLDRYDQYYIHLVLWNREKQELVGAYRLGMTDEIVARYGKKGLYTSTLFRYSRKLLEEIGPSLEMGRSFIRQEYQRTFSPLLMLWKGIARVIVMNPKYRRLFGPVSINNQYNTASRQMLEAFLRTNRFDSRLSQYVKPRNPTRKPFRRRWDPAILRRTVHSSDEMSDLISEIEKDGKGVPILLKQYLKLGGRLLGFNVDPDFSDVLDGLIAVDLLHTDRHILDRFLGKSETDEFLRFHAASAAASPPDSEPR
jgi:putative hemolysin